MPRARVVSAYLDLSTGRYVLPPAEVELDATRIRELAAKGCVREVIPAYTEPKPRATRKARPKPKGGD